MPKFDVIPDQVPSRQGSTGVRIDPNIAAPLFAADREINQAASGIVDFAIKMKEAKDFDEETSTSIKINEGFKGLLDDFGNRNDPENFDKEFDARAAELQKTEIEQGGLSFASKRRVTNNFKQQLSLNRLAANSIRDQKRIEGFRARFFVNNEKLIQDGKLEEATALLNGANQQGFIKPDEFENLKVQNKENVNFYNARDFIEANPDNLDAALKEFPVNRKNEDILKRRANTLSAQIRKDKISAFDNELYNAVLNPNFNLEDELQKVDAIEAEIGTDQANIFRTSLRKRRGELDKEHIAILEEGAEAEIIKYTTDPDYNTADAIKIVDDAESNKAITEKRAAKHRADILAKGEKKRTEEATFHILQIESDYRLGRISPETAKKISLQLIEEYARTVDGVELKAAQSLFDEVEADSEKAAKAIDSNERRMLTFADRYVADTFPVGFFSESAGDTPKEAKDNLQKLADEINKLPTEDIKGRRELQESFIRDQNERRALYIQFKKGVAAFIKQNPNVTEEEVQKRIMFLAAPHLKKDAFRKSTFDRFKTNLIRGLLFQPL